MAVYVAARDLAGFPIGTHQFIIIVPDKPNTTLHFRKPDGGHVFKQFLTSKHQGMVIGAQNVSVNGVGRLTVEFFEKSDTQAAREFLVPRAYVKTFRSDFDTEAKRVNHPGTEAAFVAQLFRLIQNYVINETSDNIPYPKAGHGYNSNTWAQSVVEAAGGKVSSDFFGYDVAHDKRIPRIYFDAVCPAQPRPQLNR